MSKTEWMKHREEVYASHDGMTKEAFQIHAQACPICAERRKTRKAMIQRQARDEAYKSCGLVKVRGAMGGTYWE